MVYLFLNGDEYLVAQALSQIKAGLGDAEMADLNTMDVEGSRTSAADLLGQAAMMPFLAPRRLVIARGYLTYLDRRMAQSKDTGSAAHAEAVTLLTGVGQVDESADLLFVDDGVDKRRALWRGFRLPEGQAVPGLAELVKSGVISAPDLPTPDAKAIPAWLQQRARERQIPIQNRAVQMLADFVGTNLRQLDNELDKLAAYADGHPISDQDVRLLVSDASEALIWDLTDALSQRNGQGAMQALTELRRGEANAFYLLTMIARQYRLILQVKEAMQSLGNDRTAIARQIKENPYPVGKAMGLSRQYAQPDLIAILERLLEVDFAMKTGADPETEIDVLVAELTLGIK